MPRKKLTTAKVKITILPHDEKTINFSFRVDDKTEIVPQIIEFLKLKL